MRKPASPASKSLKKANISCKGQHACTVPQWTEIHSGRRRQGLPCHARVHRGCAQGGQKPSRQAFGRTSWNLPACKLCDSPGKHFKVESPNAKHHEQLGTYDG